MTVKFVFSSVPVGTFTPPDAKSIPISSDAEHDHHYQVVLDDDAVKVLSGSDALRTMFIQAAYMALRDGKHESAALHACHHGVIIGPPHMTIFDDASNHNAVQGVVDDAMQMAFDLVN